MITIGRQYVEANEQRVEETGIEGCTESFKVVANSFDGNYWTVTQEIPTIDGPETVRELLTEMEVLQELGYEVQDADDNIVFWSIERE